MHKHVVLPLLRFVLLLALFASGLSVEVARAQPPDLPDSLVPMQVVRDDGTGTATFVRGPIPLPNGVLRAQMDGEDAARGFVSAYADLFGVGNVEKELVAKETTGDSSGHTHTTLQQVYQGVEVYGSQIRVHMDLAAGTVTAVGSGFLPGIVLPTIEPAIAAMDAGAVALMAQPNGQIAAAPRLVVYPGVGDERGATGAALTWLVEVRDDTLPARILYVISASDGLILDALDLLYTHWTPARAAEALGGRRLTYTAENQRRLPGTLARWNEQPPVGDTDVDNAHDFAGTTYDYFYTVHGRDSYDGEGAIIRSTVHYGLNYFNAFWNGFQMVFGDHFAVEDVMAHELTHAVTDRTAELQYIFESGALNESFSDIFGAMVDRDDWLMGEDLTDLIGGPIRDLSDPASLGQPDHADDWFSTCLDNQGVHINSGIFNKGFYNVVQALGTTEEEGKQRAEPIYYRALTTYLQPQSSFQDARSALLQATADLYGGTGTAEYAAVQAGLDAVGMTEGWTPPANECTCAATLAVARTRNIDHAISAAETIAVLYSVRDQLLKQTEIGLHYHDLYYEHTGSISTLLRRHPRLLLQAGQLLREIAPRLHDLVRGHGDEVYLSPRLTSDLLSFLTVLARTARSDGFDDLARTIDHEKERVDWSRLERLSLSQAWVYLNTLDLNGDGPTRGFDLFVPIVVDGAR